MNCKFTSSFPGLSAVPGIQFLMKRLRGATYEYKEITGRMVKLT